MLKNAFIEVEDDNESSLVLHKDSVELECLHYELGVDMDYLWDKINQIVNSNYQVIDI